MGQHDADRNFCALTRTQSENSLPGGGGSSQPIVKPAAVFVRSTDEAHGQRPISPVADGAAQGSPAPQPGKRAARRRDDRHLERVEGQHRQGQRQDGAVTGIVRGVDDDRQRVFPRPRRRLAGRHERQLDHGLLARGQIDGPRQVHTPVRIGEIRQPQREGRNLRTAVGEDHRQTGLDARLHLKVGAAQAGHDESIAHCVDARPRRGAERARRGRPQGRRLAVDLGREAGGIGRSVGAPTFRWGVVCVAHARSIMTGGPVVKQTEENMGNPAAQFYPFIRPGAPLAS